MEPETKMIRNDGSGFVDVGTSTSESGNETALGDLDLDGDLDFVLARAGVNRVLMNTTTFPPYFL